MFYLFLDLLLLVTPSLIQGNVSSCIYHYTIHHRPLIDDIVGFRWYAQRVATNDDLYLSLTGLRLEVVEAFYNQMRKVSISVIVFKCTSLQCTSSECYGNFHSEQLRSFTNKNDAYSLRLNISRRFNTRCESTLDWCWFNNHRFPNQCTFNNSQHKQLYAVDVTNTSLAILELNWNLGPPDISVNTTLMLFANRKNGDLYITRPVVTTCGRDAVYADFYNKFYSYYPDFDACTF